jgi:hypothetical protein
MRDASDLVMAFKRAVFTNDVGGLGRHAGLRW